MAPVSKQVDQGITVEDEMGDLTQSFLGSDVVFVVDGKQLHFARVLLAYHSPVFRAMFFGEGEFRDKNCLSVPLPEQSFQKFQNFLRLLIVQLKPSNVPGVEDDNVEDLLQFKLKSAVCSLMRLCTKNDVTINEFYENRSSQQNTVEEDLRLKSALFAANRYNCSFCGKCGTGDSSRKCRCTEENILAVDFEQLFADWQTK